MHPAHVGLLKIRRKTMYSVRRWLLAVIVALVLGPMVAQAASTYDFDRVRLETFDTGVQYSPGGEFSETFFEFIGTGFTVVDVWLQSWGLSFGVDYDHHLRRVSVRIDSVSYNPSTGYVTVTIRGAYHDKNSDDDYSWSVRYTVLAFG
jgi:hypothetical protein